MTITQPDLSVFETVESEVRSYCRGWPAVFDRAQGSHMYDEDGHAYLDFFAGAGHAQLRPQQPGTKRALLDYLERDGITHGLDMSTIAKRAFLERSRRRGPAAARPALQGACSRARPAPTPSRRR